MPQKSASKATLKNVVHKQPARSRKGGHPQPGGSSRSSRRPDGFIILSTDVKGRIRRLNPFGEAFFGKPEKDILGSKFSQIALPDHFEFDSRKKRFVDHFLHTPETNDVAEFETRHVSGRPRRVAWSRSAVLDTEGALSHMLYTGIDVQEVSGDGFERRLADEPGMCESGSMYSILERCIAGSKVWAWEMNANTAFCYASPGVEKLLGYSPDELIGVGMDCLLPPSEKTRFRQAIEGAINNGNRYFRFESQFRCRNGELMWTEIAGVFFRDKSGAVSGVRGLATDISQAVSLKEELVRKEKEYRYLFDNTQIALMMTNEEGVILNINQTGAKMYGREPREMTGRNFADFIREPERRDALEAFSEAYRSAKVQKANFVDIEPCVIRIDTPGGTRYLRLVPKAIKVMENNQMVGLLNTVLDITESHMLQKELERHQLQLQQLVEERTGEIQTLQEELLRDERLITLGRLTSTVGHEIRNPLGTINSSFYIISERLKGKEFGVERAIERGVRAVRRCDGIIEEMLDFTLKKSLEKRTADISFWLEKLLDDVTLPSNVTIVKLIDAGLSAPVDAGRLHRCVSNILENSLTALREDTEGIIRVSARMIGGSLEISIRDNGPGIPRKLQKRVFDPLYSTKQNGIGMGLPVCKQVMELHGGTISLLSDKGRGTTVALRLPVPHTA